MNDFNSVGAINPADLDISNLSYEDMRRLEDRLRTEAASKQSVARTNALSTIVDLMNVHDFKLGEVSKAIKGNKKPRKAAAGKPAGKVAAKYRHPETGKEWTGRGMRPKEFQGIEDLTPFLIPAAAPTPVAETVTEAPAVVETPVSQVQLTEAIATSTAPLIQVNPEPEDEAEADDPTTPLAPSSLFNSLHATEEA